MKSPESLGFLEVNLKEPEDFLKIKETLTRIGVGSKKTNTLYQSCHILHKKGKYYIVHFKEVFQLDGKPTVISLEDIQRRNLVAKLLVDWGLCQAVNFKTEELDLGDIMRKTKILKHSEKMKWNTESKHSLGKQKFNNTI